VRLPDPFEPSGDLPVVITVIINGVTFTSRPADTAPLINILPTPPAAVSRQ
jgi:hypothetical protein